MRKNIEKRNDYGKVALVAVVVFAILIAVGGASAYVASTVTINNSDGGIVNVDGDSVQQVDPISDVSFGSASDYCTGDNELAQMCNIGAYSLTLEAVGSSGSFNYQGVTTTPSVSTKYTVSTALDLTATTTAKGADDVKWLVAYYTNTGADKIVDWVGIDQSTALGGQSASYQVGTTTWVGGVIGGSLTATTSASLIASTTISTVFNTDVNNGPIDIEDLPGSGVVDDKTKFQLKNGDVLFVTWNPYTATSAASFTSAGGFTGVGKLFINFFARDN